MSVKVLFMKQQQNVFLQSGSSTINKKSAVSSNIFILGGGHLLSLMRQGRRSDFPR